MKKMKKTKISEIKIELYKDGTDFTMIVPKECVIFNDDFPFMVEYIEDLNDVSSITLFLKGYDNEFNGSRIMSIAVLGPKRWLKSRICKELDLKYRNQAIKFKKEKNYTMVGIRWDNGAYFSYFGF